MPIHLESISDESNVEDFDKRRFYIQKLNTKLLGYILDEDDLSSDSATALATQQSIKAYAAHGDFDSGLTGVIVADALEIIPHGLSAAPSRVEVIVNGETSSGTPNGGNPTNAFIAPADTNGNGTSVEWDDTNIYLSYKSLAARIKVAAGGVNSINTNIKFRAFAWL